MTPDLIRGVYNCTGKVADETLYVYSVDGLNVKEVIKLLLILVRKMRNLIGFDLPLSLRCPHLNRLYTTRTIVCDSPNEVAVDTNLDDRIVDDSDRQGSFNSVTWGFSIPSFDRQQRKIWTDKRVDSCSNLCDEFRS